MLYSPLIRHFILFPHLCLSNTLNYCHFICKKPLLFSHSTLCNIISTKLDRLYGYFVICDRDTVVYRILLPTLHVFQPHTVSSVVSGSVRQDVKHLKCQALWHTWQWDADLDFDWTVLTHEQSFIQRGIQTLQNSSNIRLELQTPELNASMCLHYFRNPWVLE